MTSSATSAAVNACRRDVQVQASVGKFEQQKEQFDLQVDATISACASFNLAFSFGVEGLIDVPIKPPCPTLLRPFLSIEVSVGGAQPR